MIRWIVVIAAAVAVGAVLGWHTADFDSDWWDEA